MPKTISHLAVSVDGFAAGPNQSLENPIGEGGLQLHQWMFETAEWARRQGIEPVPASTPDSEVVEHMHDNVGAFVMGRNMFSPDRGPWDPTWRGWWGEDPPYHAPVFVLTHHAREPLPMQGGTTFYFVTDGIASAMTRARAAAGDKDVMVAGGAGAVRQYLAAGEIDELNLHVAPVVLGSGERLFDGLGGLRLTPARVVGSKDVTHVTYRIWRPTD